MGLFDSISPVGLATAGIGLAINIGRAVAAKKNMKQAQEEIDNYQRQELKNPYAQMANIPQQSFQLASEAADRELATNASLAARSGRGAAILPQASDIYGRRNAEIGANIERYQYERDKMIGYGNSEVQAMQEERENQDIQGLANRYAVAQQNRATAFDGMGNAAAYGLENSGIDDAVQGGWNPLAGMFNRNKPTSSSSFGSQWNGTKESDYNPEGI